MLKSHAPNNDVPSTKYAFSKFPIFPSRKSPHFRTATATHVQLTWPLNASLIRKSIRNFRTVNCSSPEWDERRLFSSAVILQDASRTHPGVAPPQSCAFREFSYESYIKIAPWRDAKSERWLSETFNEFKNIVREVVQFAAAGYHASRGLIGKARKCATVAVPRGPRSRFLSIGTISRTRWIIK